MKTVVSLFYLFNAFKNRLSTNVKMRMFNKYLQSLKRSTFQISCVHRAPTVRPPWVQCAFTCVLRFALFVLTVHKALTVCLMCAHIAFTLCSPFVQHLLIVQFVFIYFNSELQNERIGDCESQQNGGKTRAYRG